MSHELRDWLRCPECGEKEMTVVRAYDASFELQCGECNEESVFTIGQDRPLHKARLSSIKNAMES